MVMKMYIYDNKQNAPSSHILDPDYSCHTSFHEEELYHFYKNVKMPNHIQTITGVYIQYQIIPINYEKDPLAYEKFAPLLQKMIVHFLNFGHANLLCNYTNSFYLIMFDIDVDELVFALLKLSSFLKQQTDTYHQIKCHFNVQYGVYSAHKYIHPYTLYNACKEQYENTIIHQSIMSVKTP